MGKGFWHSPNVQDSVMAEFPDLSPQEALRMSEKFVNVASTYGVDVDTVISEAKSAESGD